MESNLYIVLDHIEGEQPYFKTLEEAKRYILDNYTSTKEGVHPDIDNMAIVKLLYETKVVEVVGKDSYKVKFKKLKND